MDCLSEDEARRRLLAEGPNELPAGRSRNLSLIAREAFSEPVFLLLLACGTLYFFLGDIPEALLLMGFVVLVAFITIVQERKTERALDALRELASPRAIVIRDGQPRVIPGPEVVRGDTLVISPGSRVAADARTAYVSGLFIDESLLTGESVPVFKSPGETVYAGTLVVQGHGNALVETVGRSTRLGQIGVQLTDQYRQKRGANGKSRLQSETRHLVKILAIIGAGLCFMVVAAYGILRGDWLQGLLAGLTLAMAVLPNELPAVLTIFLAMGAWRIARQHVLTRQVPAVEALGSATVLCTDKTGTLTWNRMSIQHLIVPGFSGDASLELQPDRLPESLPEDYHELIEYGILASQRDPFDPLEKAFKTFGEKYLGNTEHIHRTWELQREYQLSESLFALSHVWKSQAGADYVIASKGAPEAIAELCHLSPRDRARLAESAEELAREALRPIAVAKALFPGPPLPENQHTFRFQFVGMAGLADPVREGVPEAIRQCQQAGIRVVMITGDHPETARAIARKIGLPPQAGILTGQEIDELGAKAGHFLRSRIAQAAIFARITPQQKMHLVKILQESGEVVAMTGDGVNDAPALKAAHIGIAMGERGTDTAREAASLVLLNDDFSAIVAAIRTGRRVFDNLGKAMAYLLAAHVPIAGMTVLPVFLGLPLIFLPVHIAFLHLIIGPACSVVFEAEAEEPGIMNRPPRGPRHRLFSTSLIGLSLLQGVSVLAIVLTLFLVATHRGKSADEARALSFTTLIAANIALILTNRSWNRSIAGVSRNIALRWVTLSSVLLMSIVLTLAPLRRLFRFAPLHPDDVVLCIAAGFLGIAWFELLKTLRNRKRLRICNK